MKTFSGTKQETEKLPDVNREIVEQGVHRELKKGLYGKLYEARFE